MVKRLILTAIAAVFFFLQFPIHNATALELNEKTRTIPLAEDGQETTLSDQQLANGNRLFIRECTQCHLQGKTKTNNNVSLGLRDFTEEDLYDVSGYVLVAPKLDSYWGGSIYF